MQRFFVIATALAALIAWHPQPARAAATQPCWLGKLPAMLEPRPIQVDQTIVDRATATLNALAQGTFDESQLSALLQTRGMPSFFAMGTKVVSAYGTLQSLYPFEQQITADATSTYFRARFPKETLTWVMSTDAQGKIIGLSLRRTASCKIFNIMYRSAVPY